MNPSENPITIRDIDIPFSRMVVILLKLMLASIPALILFYIIVAIITVITMAVFGGGVALLGGLLRP